jgi:DNA-directed RNA polymerase specialized sigma24 family protein
MKYVNIGGEEELFVIDRLNGAEDLSLGSLLEIKESKNELMREIENISQNRRIVIKLSLKGMSINEIADFLGWSKSKVNHLYYRGIEDLKNRMKKG